MPLRRERIRRVWIRTVRIRRIRPQRAGSVLCEGASPRNRMELPVTLRPAHSRLTVRTDIRIRPTRTGRRPIIPSTIPGSTRRFSIRIIRSITDCGSTFGIRNHDRHGSQSECSPTGVLREFGEGSFTVGQWTSSHRSCGTLVLRDALTRAGVSREPSTLFDAGIARDRCRR